SPATTTARRELAAGRCGSRCPRISVHNPPGSSDPMPESTRDPAEQARRRARLEWLLPPLLAVVAIALQLAIDVPHHEMIVRGDDDEAAEPAEKTTTA